MRIEDTGPPFPIKSSVTRKQVQDLLTAAVEGGTGYWASLGHKLRRGERFENFREGGKHQDPDEYAHPYEIIPFHEGCFLVVVETEKDEDDETREHLVGVAEMQRGLDVMAEKHPRHLGNFLDDTYDAETADVFLQCAALGELVYG